MGISWEHAGKLIRMSWEYHGNTMERNIGNSMAILWDTYGNVIWIKGATSYMLWRMLRTCCGCKARFQKACCCGTHLRQIVSLRKSAQYLSWMSDCIWKGHVLVEVWPVHFWMRRPLLRPHTVDSSNFSVRTNLIFQLRLGTGTGIPTGVDLTAALCTGIEYPSYCNCLVPAKEWPKWPSITNIYQGWLKKETGLFRAFECDCCFFL